MTEQYKIDTVAIILAEMLKESRRDEITRGEFHKLPTNYAERLVKLFSIPDVKCCYAIRLTEIYKAFPKVTYYSQIIDEILHDVGNKIEATIFKSEKIASHAKRIIESDFDYKCEIIEY